MDEKVKCVTDVPNLSWNLKSPMFPRGLNTWIKHGLGKFQMVLNRWHTGLASRMDDFSKSDANLERYAKIGKGPYMQKRIHIWHKLDVTEASDLPLMVSRVSVMYYGIKSENLVGCSDFHWRVDGYWGPTSI